MRYITILLLFFSSCSSSACDCASIRDLEGAQKALYENADIVFIGKVIEKDSDYGYRFSIVEMCKGDSHLSTVDGTSDKSCVVSPDKVGELWLVYGHFTDDGRMVMDECGISRSFDHPYLYLSGETIPGPLNTKSEDQALDIIDSNYQWAVLKQKHLEILRQEILDLRNK